MSTVLRTVGIDIFKDWLDVLAAPEGRVSQFATGFRRLIAWIGSGVESDRVRTHRTVHRDFENTLLKAGLHLYAIKPLQVWSFARSLSRRAKTDAVDAPYARHHGGCHRESAPDRGEILLSALLASVPVHLRVWTLEGTRLHPRRKAPVRRLLYMPGISDIFAGASASKSRVYVPTAAPEPSACSKSPVPMLVRPLDRSSIASDSGRTWKLGPAESLQRKPGRSPVFPNLPRTLPAPERPRPSQPLDRTIPYQFWMARSRLHVMP